MPGPTNKTNFKTYEASTRLLAAVIATNQGKIRLDFKAIATHMGGGTGKDAVNHRLRPIKALAQMMSEYVAQNKDPGDLKLPEGKGSDRATPRKKAEEKREGDASPKLASLVGGGTTGSAVDHRLRPIKQLAKLQVAVRQQQKDPGELPINGQEIHKLFGESTAAGIAWQFRDIRALGREQQEAVDQGRNPADVKPPGFGTPSRVKPPKARQPGDSGAEKRKRGGGGAMAKKKTKMAMSDEDDDSDFDSDFDAKDVHSEEKDDSGIGGEEEDDDSDVQITPTPASKRTKLPDKPRSRLSGGGASAATTFTARKNGSSSGGSGGGGDGGTPGNNGVRRSLFGNGGKPAVPGDDDDIQIVDLSGEDPPAPKTATRSSRFKAEPLPRQQFDPEEDMGLDPLMGSNSMYSEGDEYIDGEA
ncbi:hypothetical protein Hte_006668 [Hypoxylon texense]